MTTVALPIQDILQVEPGYYHRRVSNHAERRPTNIGDTLNCPCDICPSSSECQIFCVRFNKWVIKGKNYLKD